MRAYDFILFLALLGAINSALDYMYQSEFSDNWFSTHSESWNMNMVNINSDTINSLEDGDTISGDEHDSIYSTGKALAKIVTGTFWMLFSLDDMVLDKIFYVPDPSNPERNLFAPINDIIMVGIYIIVAFGIYQVKTKTSVKHYE